MGRTCGRNEKYEILTGRPEIKRSLEINLHRLENSIKINVTESADWIHLARGTAQ
jgi:hypothetical protein